MKFFFPALGFLGWMWTFSPMLHAEDPKASPSADAAPETSQPAPADPLAGGGKAPPTPSGKAAEPNGETGANHQPATGMPRGESETSEENKPPLTPENANLNLATDLEFETLDTREKVFLPAGTYRQILKIPIDSPTMEAAQKLRQERRPSVKVSDPLLEGEKKRNQPLWIRYESLEKIKINEEERRGGLDLPVHGPAGLHLRLWYAKSEDADWASSIFYFVFGGLGYSTANFLGWSVGNTREIPGDFEYRLIRR